MGHFRIYPITFSCPSKILQKHCFQFLLGLKPNLKLCLSKISEGRIKEYYGRFENFLCKSGHCMLIGHLFCLFVCLFVSVCLSVCLSVFLSLFVFFVCVCFFVSLFLCFFVSLFLCFFVSLFLGFLVSLFLFFCFFVSLFLCFFVSLFLCFFVSLFLCFFVSLFLCFFLSFERRETLVGSGHVSPRM